MAPLVAKVSKLRRGLADARPVRQKASHGIWHSVRELGGPGPTAATRCSSYGTGNWSG